jgi:hypothetical protein
MSDKYVTVATFNKSFEAQLAKNLLESEGIESMLGGSLASDVLFGSVSADQIMLQVHEGDAQRATGILASAVDKDWEDQAEAGVWTCSICGEPISERLSVCYSCQTPRNAIRAAAPFSSDIQRQPSRQSASGEISEREQVTPNAPPEPVNRLSPAQMGVSTADKEKGEADESTLRTLWALVVVVVLFILLLLWWYNLIKG